MPIQTKFYMEDDKEDPGKYLAMPPDMLEALGGEIKALLHSNRDAMRNRGIDTRTWAFDVRDGYYGEAFGILRALFVMGYGYLGPVNISGLEDKRRECLQPEQNLNWWFSELNREVLAEEGWADKTHRCEWCRERYGKDTAAMPKQVS